MKLTSTKPVFLAHKNEMVAEIRKRVTSPTMLSEMMRTLTLRKPAKVVEKTLEKAKEIIFDNTK